MMQAEPAQAEEERGPRGNQRHDPGCRASQLESVGSAVGSRAQRAVWVGGSSLPTRRVPVAPPQSPAGWLATKPAVGW